MSISNVHVENIDLFDHIAINTFIHHKILLNKLEGKRQIENGRKKSYYPYI